MIIRSCEVLFCSVLLALTMDAVIIEKANALPRKIHFVVYKMDQSPLKLNRSTPLALRNIAGLSLRHQGFFQNVHSHVASLIDADRLVGARPLWIADGAEMNLTPAQVSLLKKSPHVLAVLPLNRRGRLTDFTYGLKRIKIPELRTNHSGIDGNGISVGVIDTGIDAKHPDLMGRVVAYRDFVDPKVLQPRDDQGHGTHVAGTIAGGATSGRSIGVAPKVNLVIAKTYNSRGSARDIDLLSAMQWMTDPDDNPATADAPRVVNSSWNVDGVIGSIDFTLEPFCIAISNMRTLGIASVIAAGNDGPRRNSIKIPGACPDAVTVASTDSSDRLTDSSSRGPSLWQNGTIQKPNVSAPGKDISSSTPGGGYRTRSGTSMASPHVVGMFALVFQKNALLTVDEAQRLVESQATDIESAGYDTATGWGLINSVSTIDQI